MGGAAKFVAVGDMYGRVGVVVVVGVMQPAPSFCAKCYNVDM